MWAPRPLADGSGTALRERHTGHQVSRHLHLSLGTTVARDGQWERIPDTTGRVS